MPTLPDLLTDRDLAVAELHAVKLDGQLVPLGHGFRVIDHPESREARLDAIAAHVPDRMIVCEESAAWLWGALPDAPEPLRVCSLPRHRARLTPSGRIVARELRLQPSELVALTPRHGAGRTVMVTTRLRTAIDLARGAARTTAAIALRAMVGEVGVAPDEVRDALNEHRRRPGRLAALRAVDLAESTAKPDQPLLTR